jgi:hypothetical protein
MYVQVSIREEYPTFLMWQNIIFVSKGNVSYTEYQLHIIENKHFFVKMVNFKNVLINILQHRYNLRNVSKVWSKT